MGKRILIAGGSGMFGQYLNVVTAQENNISTLYNTHSGNCAEFKNDLADITNIESIKKIFNSFKPGVVTHSVASANPIHFPG